MQSSVNAMQSVETPGAKKIMKAMNNFLKEKLQ